MGVGPRYVRFFKEEYRRLSLSSYCDVISEAIIMKFTFVEIRFNIRGPFCMAYIAY